MTVTPILNRIRVISMIDYLVPFGGAEVLVQAIATRLDRSQFEPIICATRFVDPGVRRGLESEGVRVISLKRNARFDLAAWRPLVSLLREGPCVLHTHKFGSNAWGAAIRRLVPMSVLIGHEHVWSFEGEPMRRAVDRMGIGRAADLILTVSRHTREQMIALERLSPERVAVFTHGVPSLNPAKLVDRAAIGINDDDFVVGTVCVLRPQKAIDDLLRAAAILINRIPQLRVVIVGDGPERRSLEMHADALGLGRVVNFIGNRGDVAAIVPRFDVFASSSHFEGSPLAVMEAMAASRAIVATSVGGVPEIISDGNEGVLVPPSDPVALATAVERLYAHGEFRRELGANAQRRQRQEFDLDVNVKRLESLYGAMFAHSRRAGPRRAARGAAGVAMKSCTAIAPIRAPWT